jgi:hypothetical protein
MPRANSDASTLLDRCGLAEAVDHEIGAFGGKRARNA